MTAMKGSETQHWDQQVCGASSDPYMPGGYLRRNGAKPWDQDVFMFHKKAVFLARSWEV